MLERSNPDHGGVLAPDPVLRMESIRKEFPGVLALDGVDLSVRAGEVHVLLGENGAGKSTLMKILSGAHRMDAGRIVAEGSPRQLIERHSTREVLELRFGLDEMDELGAIAGELEGLADRIEILPDRLLLYTADGDAATAAVHDRGVVPASVLARRATLEDVFLGLAPMEHAE